MFGLAGGLVSAQSVVSGEYEDLVLAVSRDGVLTGYFNQGTGDDGRGNPRFSCTFFMRGTSEGSGRYEVTTWHPAFPDEVIMGELILSESDGRRSVMLRLHGEHGGCWNVAPMLKDDEGVEFELTKEGKWESLRMVASARAYFHASANARSRQRSYVVKNDLVRVMRISDGWAEVAYVAPGGNASQGWLQDKDLYPIAP